jgi:hypothetical protein
MIFHLVGLAVANLLFLSAGVGITAAFGQWHSMRQLVSNLPIAYMVGVAAMGISVQLMLVAGLSLSLPQVVGVCVTLAALAFLRRPRLAEPGSPPIPFRLVRLPQVGLGVVFGLLLIECAVQALDTWDSFAIWSMKARAIALFGGLRPELFASKAYAAANLDYPLLFPGLQAVDFRFMGSIDTQVIHVQSWLLLGGWLLASAQLLKGRAHSFVVWPALGLAAAAPATITLVQEGYADVPVAVFGALAALSAWLYLVEHDTRSAGLLAVFATASAATKREAWVFAAALFLIAFVFAFRRRRPLLPLAVGLLLLVVTVSSWLAWLARHGYTSHEDVPLLKSLDPAFLFGRLGRAGHAIVSLADYSMRPSLWLVVIPLTAAVAFVASRGPAGDAARFLAGLLALQYAALVWVFWISREPVQWHLDHAGPRVVSTPVFVAASFLPLLTKTPGSSREQAVAADRARAPN